MKTITITDDEATVVARARAIAATKPATQTSGCPASDWRLHVDAARATLEADRQRAVEFPCCLDMPNSEKAEPCRICPRRAVDERVFRKMRLVHETAEHAVAVYRDNHNPGDSELQAIMDDLERMTDKARAALAAVKGEG